MVSLMPLHPKELYAVRRIQREATAPGASRLPNGQVYQKKWEIVHQATCTKHEHKDLQHRQQSSSSGEKIRIPSDGGAQRHKEQMVQELQLSQR